MKKKLCAFALLGLFAAASYAQSNPPGAAVPPHTPGVATDRAQQAGEARKAMRPEEGVNRSAGDTPRVAEGGAIGTGKAARSGEQRVERREM
ncbi:MAG: cell envelope biogenesis protein TolA, partial [Gammaproteobacteria bacterium]|nr:cell envelope biogenesis protein TolA [Gammaproteobacteria bacterium]